MVDQKCWSSCLLLYLSGAVRSAQPGQIGIHHPYFDPAYFAKLPTDEAERIYKEQVKSFQTYLQDQGFPQSLYEKLMATNSRELYFLQQDDLKLIGMWPPYFEEELLARCGPSNDHATPQASDRWIACVHSIVTPASAKAIRALLPTTDRERWDNLMAKILH